MKETFEERLAAAKKEIERKKLAGEPIILERDWSKESFKSLCEALGGRYPCKFDHNGECLICDSWPSDCAYKKLISGDFKFESFNELMKIFDGYLSDREKNELKEKYKQNA